MPENAYKRRLRRAKRRIVSSLSRSGYTVLCYENEPFHVGAFNEKELRLIRILFENPTPEEIERIGRRPAPPASRRELWIIDSRGQVCEKNIV